MTPDTPRIAFVMGDPAGISNELGARILADRGLTRDCSTLVIGDRRMLAWGERIAGVSVEVTIVANPADASDAAGAISLFDLGHGDPATIKLAEASAAGGAFALRNFKAGQFRHGRDRFIAEFTREGQRFTLAAAFAVREEFGRTNAFT